jgi:hypothetical protein
MLKEPGWGFEELDSQLHNGFHDAEIENIQYDLVNREVALQLLVWIGSMSDPPTQRERYRRGCLRFEQVKFFAKTAPYDGSDSGLTILSCGSNGELQPQFKAGEPSGPHTYRIFTGYCELDIECPTYKWAWVGEEINRNC